MRKNIIVPLTIGALIFVGLLIFGGYAIIEPLETEAIATTTTVTLNVTEEVSITPPAAITMSPNITASQNSSIGTGDSWNVKTNSQLGYTLTLKDDGTPALQDTTTTESFADYATSSPTTWSVPSGQYQFGFSVLGNDVVTTTWGTGSDCGSGGTPSATLKYSGFKGTTEITVATSSSETSTSGATTTMCVAAEQNGIYAPDGTYITTITGTATAN
ncbi:hypothetical protein KJA17_02215 [Patescibacteria group bacterium]|nr:hypothetical protein [Patescibacteria group bacterium]